jgi:NAD(P)-dependent dehydrogenase (short-subunit alcohol dehydrogenase family)
LAVRFRSKGDKVAAEFRAAYPAATIEVWELKMGDYDSVLAFARRVEGEFSNSGDSGKTKLDMAILNAGMAGSEFTRNAKTGHCQVVRVNYLSTFLLATVLVPVLRDVKGERPGRLTIVGSGGVFAAKLPNRGQRPFLSSFDDLAVQAWGPMERYFSSKVLGMLFFVRLYDYLPAADQVVVNMVDPGMCKGSELGREATGLTGAVRSVLGMVLGRPVEDGAWTYVDAAVVQGKDLHGSFVRDWKICPYVVISTPSVCAGLLTC